MWSIVVVLSALFSGPEIHAVTEAGIFKTEKSCEAAIAEGVKTQLEGEAKTEYEGGYRKFICVRAMGSDALEHLK